MASATSRIRLSTGILIAALRPAALLAKIAATLDVLSGGRLELGVGTGWQREEYEAVGLDFERRGQLLSDTLEACQALWRDAPVSVDTPNIRLSGIYCMPRPLQPGGVPLWIAGTLHRRNLERVVRFGSGWIPIMGESAEGIAFGVATIRRALEFAGRPPDSVAVRAPVRPLRGNGGFDLPRSLEVVPELLETGVSDIQVGFQPFCPDPRRAEAFFADLVDRFHNITGLAVESR
jgi:probable F420-dependent oxidoreductase